MIGVLLIVGYYAATEIQVQVGTTSFCGLVVRPRESGLAAIFSGACSGWPIAHHAQIAV